MKTKTTKRASANVRPIIMVLGLALSVAAMLGIGLAYPSSSAATATTAGTGSSQTSTYMPDTTCELEWRNVPSPNAEAAVNGLSGVAVVSAADVWAVGTYYFTDENGTHWGNVLTMHWDGSSWSSVSNPGEISWVAHHVTGVTVVSANDVWVVGYQSELGPSGCGNWCWEFTMHWDGSSWSMVPTPPQSGHLYSVAAVSANDVWAVGTIIMHWDGSSWTIVPSPPATLYSVAAVSANDVWAVGYSGTGALTMHWDGSTWSVIPNPSSGSLSSVTAISANDVWAVGSAGVTMHWDGVSWSVVPSPATGDLSGVAAVSTNDVWALGSGGLTMRWAGSIWSVVPNPSPGGLNGVAVVSANDVWAVGSYYNGSSYRTLTMHYSEDCQVSTPTPTPTSTPTSTPTNTSTPTPTRTPTSTPTPVPDFTLNVSPTSRSVGRPGTTTYTVNLMANSSYSGSVSLSVSGLPDRIDYSFSPNPVALTPGGNGSSVLTITTRRNTPAGTYTLTVRGTDGVRTRSQTVTLIVNR